jgi:hypothetical protein
MEEQDNYEKQEDHGDSENEKEQHFIIIFRAERLEVLLKMNKPNLVGLMGAFKRGLSKNVTFKPAKLGNFDKVRD